MNTSTRYSEHQLGMGLALFAYIWWGFAPIFWHQLYHVDAIHAVVNRMLWSGPTLLLVVGLIGQWQMLKRACTNLKIIGLLLLSGAAVTFNWGIYVWGVLQGNIKEVSLGYYLLPLINVLAGFIIFKERPNPTQWLAILVASSGIVIMLVTQGSIPWLAIAVAVSFSLYGIIRKVTPVDAMAGNTLESLLLVPFAIGWMWFNHSTASLGQFDTRTDMYLVLSGAFTVIPLISYIAAAQRVTLTSMSLIFYLGPSLQMLLAIFLYGEHVSQSDWAAFICIAIALTIHTSDLLRKLRRK